ncbi:MAG: hypothetical protein KZQ93_14895 [Candidatus Thiodiazotropha sp. (ex Monitilora ramsayi)]|nr:hypothetical protein [Candidatus Thiodiazotropha sp. (ex Monitilora ramsayi)]
MNRKAINTVIAMMSMIFFTMGTASAANDPSISGDTRSKVNSAMSELINRNTVKGVYSHFDPVKGVLHDLELVKLHDGIVKKGNYYVSCADFRTSKGKLVDIDFLVLENDGNFVATQAVVHKADNKKRKYHLEN